MIIETVSVTTRICLTDQNVTLQAIHNSMSFFSFPFFAEHEVDKKTSFKEGNAAAKMLLVAA